MEIILVLQAPQQKEPTKARIIEMLYRLTLPFSSPNPKLAKLGI
jgi:hypothetical protein